LGRGEDHIRICYGYLRKRDHMEDPGFIKMDIQEVKDYKIIIFKGIQMADNCLAWKVDFDGNV
jgi:hypothetical protein